MATQIIYRWINGMRYRETEPGSFVLAPETQTRPQVPMPALLRRKRMVRRALREGRETEAMLLQVGGIDHLPRRNRS